MCVWETVLEVLLRRNVKCQHVSHSSPFHSPVVYINLLLADVRLKSHLISVPDLICALSRSHLHSRKINLWFKMSRIRAALAGGKCQGAFCLNDYWQKDLWSRKQFKKKRAILLSVCVAASLRQSAIISKHESMNTPRKQTNNSMRRVC